MTLTTLIVDEETVARNRLKRMLADVADVADVDGFGVVAALADDQLPGFVFVTANDEYIDTTAMAPRVGDW
jgi:DNA-binding LytR/AlgR family response regulator